MEEKTIKQEPKTEKIGCRITKTEKKAFDSLFKKARVGKKKYTQADFFRDSIFDKPLGEKVQVIKTEVIYRDRPCADESKKIYHLQKIGTNLNQIAHHTNKSKSVDQEVLQKLENIEELLKALI